MSAWLDNLLINNLTRVSYTSSAANPALSGLLRGVSNAVQVAARNALNTQDLGLVSTTATDDMVLGDANTTSVQIGAGFLQFGLLASNPSTAGSLRLLSGSRVMSRGAGNTFNLVNVASDASDNIQCGDATNGASVQLQAKTGGFVAVNLGGASVATAGTIRFGKAAQLWALDNAGTGNILLVGADATDNVFVGEGLNTASVTLNTKTGGSLSLQAGNTAKFSANSTGVGFYATAPIAQAARVGQLTDSTGGSPTSTLAAITAGAAYAQADMVAVKNALASLAARFNASELADHNIGVTA